MKNFKLDPNYNKLNQQQIDAFEIIYRYAENFFLDEFTVVLDVKSYQDESKPTIMAYFTTKFFSIDIDLCPDEFRSIIIVRKLGTDLVGMYEFKNAKEIILLFELLRRY